MPPFDAFAKTPGYKNFAGSQTRAQAGARSQLFDATTDEPDCRAEPARRLWQGRSRKLAGVAADAVAVGLQKLVVRGGERLGIVEQGQVFREFFSVVGGH